jgi:hypothetical protein
MSLRCRIVSPFSFLVRVSCVALACATLLATPAGAQAYHFAFGVTPANGPSWGTGPHSNTVSVTNDGSSTIPAGAVISLENRMGTGLNNLTFVTGSGTFNGTKVTQNGPCTPFATSPYIGTTGHYASLNCKGTLNSAFTPGQTITATYTFTITTPAPQSVGTSNNLLDCGTGWVVTTGWTFTGGGVVSCGAAAAATTGTLVVRKVVVNTLGVANPATFAMVTHCSANAATPGTNTPVSVPPGGSVTQSPPVAAGDSCNVTETLPPSVLNVPRCGGASASWSVAYSPAVTITANGTSVLTVTNTLTCDKVQVRDSLHVHKIVVNNTGGPAPIPATFNTTTNCAVAGAVPVNTPVPVPGNQTVTQSTPVATGAICSVTEVLPPAIASLDACKGQGATWSATYSPPVTIVAGQPAVLTVTNTLTCNRPTGGTLQIHKTVVNTLGVPTPPVFNMTATCSGMTAVSVPVAVNATVTVPPAGQIPNGTVCTIAETLPPHVTGVKACPSGTATWVASNPGSLTIHTAQTTGTIITNTLTCDKPNSSDCPNPGMSTIGCRVTVTIKRSKGPAIYSVAVSPAPTSPTPTPNIAPSTSTSCVIAGAAMINQTTCWFNYNTNATQVTLTATSSAGPLPAGFGWTGPCIPPSGGSSATCVVSATLSMPPSVIANFP